MVKHDEFEAIPLSKGEHRTSCPTLCGPYGYCGTPYRRRLIGIIATIAIILVIVIAVVTTRKNDNNNNDIPANGIWTNVRLNHDVIPNHYHLNYIINLTRFDFTGTESIEMNVVHATDTIIIHQGLDMDVNNVVIQGPNSTLYEPASTFQYTKNEYLVLQMGSLLPVGEYVMNLTFSAKLQTNLNGLYRSSYETLSGETRYLATTQFEPTGARDAFPCFDEPTFKANFTITITCEPQYHALSNMPIKKETQNIDSKTYEFDTSVKMSTYLVAFVVSDFVSVTANTTSTKFPTSKKISIWTHKDQINQTSVALEVATKIITHYEEVYDIEFPLPKQDLIAIPDYSGGAMENWGLITFEELSLLYDSTSSSQVNEQRVVTVVAHELAHQWFGDLVTTNWWSELWLNEGYAQFMEYEGTNAVRPEWDMFNQFLIIAQREAMIADSVADTHSVIIPVTTGSDASQMFDDITYDKGASLNRMIQGFLTKPIFYQGLHNYLQKYAYGNTYTADLMTELSAVSSPKIDVGKIMDGWLNQEGFPVLMLQEVPNGIQVKQQRFFSTKGESNTKWHIYVTTRVPSSNTTYSTWLTPAVDSIIVPYDANTDAFIKFDVDENNMYRVNYPQRLWGTLSKAMLQQDTTLSIADRAGILSDAFALAEADLLSYDITLNMTRFLQSEHNYIIWEMAQETLLRLGERLYGTESYEMWRKYMQTLVIRPYQQIGWNATDSKGLDSQLRAVILNLACEYEVSDCRDYAKSLFENFMNNNVTIDANIRDIVYRVGIADGYTTYFDYLYQHYMQSNIISESDRILEALAASRNPWQLQQLLRDTLNENRIRSQDTMTVIENIASNPIGSQYAWNFVRDNWSTLSKRYGRSDVSFGNLIRRVTSGMSSQREYDQVEAFITAQSANLGTASRSATQALTIIQSNIDWLNKNLVNVTNWLKQL